MCLPGISHYSCWKTSHWWIAASEWSHRFAYHSNHALCGASLIREAVSAPPVHDLVPSDVSTLPSSSYFIDAVLLLKRVKGQDWQPSLHSCASCQPNVRRVGSLLDIPCFFESM